MLRSDRSFLLKSPEGQHDAGVLGGDGGAGGGKFGSSAVGRRGGRAALCCLSVCLPLYVSYGTFTGSSQSGCTARERINVQA